MQTVLKKIVWGCLLVVPFLALYVSDGRGIDIINWGTSGLYFPFIAGKNLAFRLLVEIAFAAWVVLAYTNKGFRIDWKKSPLLIAYGVFILVLLVADLFGVDVYKSFWSNFERMEGFVGHIHFFLYFVVLHGMLHNLASFRTVLKAHVVGNVLVLLWALGQLLGAQGYFFASLFPKAAAWFSAQFPIHMSLNRLDATIGNSAYFAMFCLFFVFIAALLWSQTKSTLGKRVYPVIVVANLIMLFYSGTRGTMIGLVVGGLATLALIAWKEKGHARKVLLGAIVACCVFLALLFTFKDSTFVQSQPTLVRLASISFKDLTAMSRLSIWTISYEAFKEKPLLGYGQDNFSHIFAAKFIPEKMWNLEPWYDRSHNVFFDWLVAAGVLGLASYLSLFVVAFYLMWNKKSLMPHRERAILSGAFIGYFVHNIFVFDNLTSYIIFFTLLVYVIVRSKGDAPEVHVKDSDASVLEPVVFIALLVSLYYMVYQPYHVSTLTVRAMDINRYIQTMPFSDVLKQSQDAFLAAIDMNTLGSLEAEEQFMQVGPKLALVTLPATLSPNERAVATQAINGLVDAIKTHISSVYEKKKNDPRALAIFGNALGTLGAFAEAEPILVQANTIAPKKQLISFDLIRTYLALGKYPQAAALAEQTYRDAPDYPDAVKWYLTSAALAHTYEAAEATIAADGKMIPADADVVRALVTSGQVKLALNLLANIKKANPQYTAEIDAFIKEILAQPIKK